MSTPATDFGRAILTASDATSVLTLLGIALGVDGGDSGDPNVVPEADGGAPTGSADLIINGEIPGVYGAFPFSFSYEFPTEIQGLTIIDGGTPGSNGPLLTLETTDVDGGSP
jgi:hypothetical protein